MDDARWRRTRVELPCRILLGAAALVAPAAAQEEQPNVVLIMTDDQGYGDFGFTGNPALDTPQLDRLAAQSARVEPFYVCPVCAPTRASLMTGRYHYRTRVVDTWIGRAMMDPDEVTLAEILQGAGYATGLFGKWHLGDCHPMRPQDQGFDEVLMHRGGGIGQPSDPVGGEGRYTDPVLIENGVPRRFEGYCTDVYFRRAIEWIEAREASGGGPWFCYLPTNAPHGPYHDVPEELYEKYRARDLGNHRFEQVHGHELPDGPDEKALDRRARIFAMCENIDRNVGRLLDALDGLHAARDTIVVFLVDNGPQQRRFTAGFRGWKSHVHEGGVRSPFLVRWPGVLDPGRLVERVSAHIDVLPTLLDACGVAIPAGLELDGRSLWPALRGRDTVEAARSLVIQAHRGDRPQPFHHFFLRRGDWKLLRASGFGREQAPRDTAFELYHLGRDPYEEHDLARVRPDVVAELMQEYLRWWEDVSRTRPDNFEPPWIVVGTARENPTVLTRQDWRRNGPGSGWADDATGAWRIRTEEPGRYRVDVRFRPRGGEAVAVELRSGDLRAARELEGGATAARFEDVRLEAGPQRLEVRIELAGGETVGAHQVELSRTDLD